MSTFFPPSDEPETETETYANCFICIPVRATPTWDGEGTIKGILSGKYTVSNNAYLQIVVSDNTVFDTKQEAITYGNNEINKTNNDTLYWIIEVNATKDETLMHLNKGTDTDNKLFHTDLVEAECSNGKKVQKNSTSSLTPNKP